ncbi:MAG TPA: helix-turn-helix domain-containing protein, partial [Chloroflexota bacterium]|nr:helix-turn-helix domain-containing protein [Chloroflexota bacterium]
FLRDENGKAYGAFCVNFEITGFMTFQRTLDAFTATDERTGVTEMLTDDIQTTIHSLVAETLLEMGDSASMMSRDDKIKLVQRLQGKGVFQVKKAVPILADLLGLSRATLYNYLRESRVD